MSKVDLSGKLKSVSNFKKSTEFCFMLNQNKSKCRQTIGGQLWEFSDCQPRTALVPPSRLVYAGRAAVSATRNRGPHDWSKIRRILLVIILQSPVGSAECHHSLQNLLMGAMSLKSNTTLKISSCFAKWDLGFCWVGGGVSRIFMSAWNRFEILLWHPGKEIDVILLS